MFDATRGYFYGTLLGDGHINYTQKALSKPGRRGPMLMLKVCDYEFIERWRDCIEAITGFRYKISKHNPGKNSGGHRQQYKLRVASRELVDEAETLTVHKTKIPDAVWSGDRATKVSFSQGLMDSEGWINFYLAGGVGQCDMTLGFGCGDPFFDEFYELIQSLGVGVSKVYKRKPTFTKSGNRGKQLKLFKMDIRTYMDAGLGFTIKRKADRLAFCSRILNDYTRDYPRYEDYYRMEDIV